MTVQRRMVRKITDKATLDFMKRKNNPYNEPTGPFTGRCANCASTEIWAKNGRKTFGCHKCGAHHDANMIVSTK